MQLNDASFSQLRVLAFFYCGANSVSVSCEAMLSKNDRKALKAYLDLCEDGGLFYWQLHVKISCEGHLPGVDL